MPAAVLCCAVLRLLHIVVCRSVLGRIMDGSRFEEFKSNYGKTLVTGGHVGLVQLLPLSCSCVHRQGVTCRHHTRKA